MGKKSDNARAAVSAPRLSLAAARELLLSLARATGEEEIEPSLALGRTSSQAVYSRHANPNYRAAAMDGIAVRAADTITAGEASPCTLPEHRSGDTAPTGACAPVDTGMAMPDWADAVVMVEHSEQVEGGWQITSPATGGKHVRRAGEDVGAGVQLLGRGCRVGAAEIGAMLATGVETLKLRLPPTVAILATGDEVIQPGQAAAPGAVIEFNSRVPTALLQERGATSQEFADVDAFFSRFQQLYGVHRATLEAETRGFSVFRETDESGMIRLTLEEPLALLDTL